MRGDEEKRRLLIVEDDWELHTVLERSARRRCRDLVVDWAGDLNVARRCLRGQRYDAILIDYMLSPDARGTSLVPECRRLHAHATIAVMSARPLEELLRCVSDPTMRLLPKPFTSGEFVDFVGSMLEDFGAMASQARGRAGSSEGDLQVEGPACCR